MLEKIQKKYGFTTQEMERIRAYSIISEFKEETLCSRIEDLFKELTSLKYKKSEIKKMINIYPSILYPKAKTIVDKKKKLEQIGFGKNLKKITVYCPQILGYDSEKIKNRIQNLIDYGFIKEEVLKMVAFAPSIIGSEESVINSKLDNLEGLGLSKEQIIKVVKKLPSAITYSIKSLNDKYNNLITQGFNNSQALKIITVHPAILSYSIPIVNQKLSDIKELGFTKEEVLQIIYNLPSLLSGDFANAKNRINYLLQINLRKVILEKTKNLIQSVEVTYAKYNYLIDIGEEINEEQYSHLFLGNPQFKAKYKISKETLLERYNYDEYIKEKRRKNGHIA